MRDFPSAELTGELLIEVSWSSLNYKDGLAARPDGKVARSSPLVLGVDHVGVVRESSDARFAVGDTVIAHGHDLGVSHHGGLAEWSRVPADWAVPLPAGLSPRETMILGTAGYTAAASVLALERHGLTPDDGPVLVTGATGGVGSSAVAMLAAHGYTVHASTGKADAADWLRGLGASEVIDREARHEPRGRVRSRSSSGQRSSTASEVRRSQARSPRPATAAPSRPRASPAAPASRRPSCRSSCATSRCSASTRRRLRRLRGSPIWERVATDLRPADLEKLVAREIGLDRGGRRRSRSCSPGTRADASSCA